MNQYNDFRQKIQDEANALAEEEFLQTGNTDKCRILLSLEEHTDLSQVVYYQSNIETATFPELNGVIVQLCLDKIVTVYGNVKILVEEPSMLTNKQKQDNL